jgi:hypothetical protein
MVLILAAAPAGLSASASAATRWQRFIVSAASFNGIVAPDMALTWCSTVSRSSCKDGWRMEAVRRWRHSQRESVLPMWLSADGVRVFALERLRTYGT